MIAFFKKLFGMSKPQLAAEPIGGSYAPASPFNLDLEAGDLVVVRKSIDKVVACGSVSSTSVEPVRGYAWIRPHFHSIGSGVNSIDGIRFMHGVHYYTYSDGSTTRLYACKATPEEYELAKAQILCANKACFYEIAARDIGAAIPHLNIEELEKLHRELEYFYPMLDGIVNRHCGIPKEEVNDQQ